MYFRGRRHLRANERAKLPPSPVVTRAYLIASQVLPLLPLTMMTTIARFRLILQNIDAQRGRMKIRTVASTRTGRCDRRQQELP